MRTGKQVYVGVDAGGSKTKLTARSAEGTNEVHLEGPGANPQRIGVDAAAQRLLQLIRRAMRHFPDATSIAVCAGVAGAGQTDDQNDLDARIRRGIDAWQVESVQVVHDAAIALEAAFEGGSGIVVIAGTGSVVFARTTAGTRERVGGWGYLLGDEGSGHAIGREGLSAVADAMDGGPATRLRAAVAERYGLDTRDALIHRIYGEEWAVQEVAPLVIEASASGDAVARAIVADQADKLAQQVEWLTDRNDAISPRIALTGGLIREAHYAKVFEEALDRRLPDWTLTTPMHPPVIGALHLARQAVTEDDETLA